jgi:hypothetical protein
MESTCAVLGVVLIFTLVMAVVISVFITRKQAAVPPRPPGFPPIPMATLFDEQRVTRSQLLKLLNCGLIDLATHDRVVAALEEYQRPKVAPVAPALPARAQPAQPPPLPMAARAQSLRPIPVQPFSAVGAVPVAPPAGQFERTPHRTLGQVFQSFLRESNIRWGELVGGMLIVGCSIALVISFWTQIESRPLLQFGIFISVTAAALGLGLYAEQHWRVPTTSRGILLIATLLVPLNFLAMASFSRASPASLATTIGQLLAVVALGLLVWAAAKVLVPPWRASLSIGVMALSAATLIAQRLIHLPGQVLSLWLPAALALAAYTGPAGTMLYRARRWRSLSGYAVESILVVLGILTFAVLLSAGFIVLAPGQPLPDTRVVLPILSLGAAPSLITGLLLWTQIRRKRLAHLRTLGTALTFAAAFWMVAALVLAWPEPRHIVPLGVLNFLVLTAVALAFDIPLMHAVAAPCIALAWLVGWHAGLTHVNWNASTEAMAQTLILPSGGIILATLFALVFAGCITLMRTGRHAHSVVYAWIGRAIAGLSLILALGNGVGIRGDPNHVTWLCLGYAVLCAPWAARGIPWAGWATWLLLGVGLVDAFMAHAIGPSPVMTALLAHATVAIGTVIAVSRFVPSPGTPGEGRVGAVAEDIDREHASSRLGDSAPTRTLARSTRRGGKDAPLLALTFPAEITAQVSSVLTAILLAATMSLATTSPAAWRVGWLGSLWLALAMHRRSIVLWTASQAAFATAAVLGTLAVLAQQRWFSNATDALLEPRTWQTIGIVLAMLVLTFRAINAAMPNGWLAWSGRNSPLTFDRLLTIALLGALAVFAALRVIPSVQLELGTVTIGPESAAWGWNVPYWPNWPLLALLAVIFVLWIGQGLWSAGAFLLIATVMLACPLIASRPGPDSGATLLRWTLALATFGLSAVAWRHDRLPFPLNRKPVPPELPAHCLAFIAILGALPIVTLSAYPAWVAIQGQPPPGPFAKSIFYSMGLPLSHALPLAILALTFVRNSIKLRSTAWVIASLVAIHLAVTLSYVFWVFPTGSADVGIHWIHLTQLNALTLALFALAWRWLAKSPQHRLPIATTAMAVIAIAANVALLVPAAAWLVLDPTGANPLLAAVGQPLGWLALLAAVGAIVPCGQTPTWDRASWPVLLALCLLLSGASAEAIAPGSWLGFHVLMAGATGAAMVVLSIALWSVSRNRLQVLPALALPSVVSPPTANGPVAILSYARSQSTPGSGASFSLLPASLRLIRASRAYSIFAVLLALRSVPFDPQAGTWASTIIALIGVLWMTGSVLSLRSHWLYAGLLINLAVTVNYFTGGWPWPRGAILGLAPSCINIAVLTLVGLAGMVIDRSVFVPRNATRPAHLPPFHRFAATAAVGWLLIIAALLLTASVAEPFEALWLGTALAASLVIAIALLRDRRPFELYAWGVSLMLIVLHILEMAGYDRWSSAAIVVSAFVLITSTIGGSNWCRRSASSLGDGSNPRWPDIDWLVRCSLALAAVAITSAAASQAQFGELFDLRLWVAAATLLQFIGLILLTRHGPRSAGRIATLVLAVIAVAVAGSAFEPADASRLDRCIAVVFAVAVCAITIEVVAARLAVTASVWGVPIEIARQVATAAWLAGLLAVVATEFEQRAIGGVLPAWKIAAVALAFVAASAHLLRWALLPAQDPWCLGSTARQVYVYLTEVLLAMSVVHLRLTAPQLFTHRFAPYWPLIVVALAFAGVLLGELFQRRRILVLSSPLLRTGVILPLLPVLAFAALPSKVDYAVLLFVVSLFYAIASAVRTSLVLGLLAALAANAGVWTLLSRQPALAFFVHPQLWVIPIAASVLIASQINQEHLSAQAVRFIRYACLILVYVSSTADIFLNGVADHPWLPLVLASLSVIGVLLGILLRIRPFLFLGTAFLGLSIVTMIQYAAISLHSTWIWSVAGIVLGAAIIALFALFEQKRASMLEWVEELKGWE